MTQTADVGARGSATYGHLLITNRSMLTLSTLLGVCAFTPAANSKHIPVSAIRMVAMVVILLLCVISTPSTHVEQKHHANTFHTLFILCTGPVWQQAAVNSWNVEHTPVRLPTVSGSGMHMLPAPSSLFRNGAFVAVLS